MIDDLGRFYQYMFIYILMSVFPLQHSWDELPKEIEYFMLFCLSRNTQKGDGSEALGKREDFPKALTRKRA